MAKKVMSAPERADYFRVFAHLLLKDDAYEYLGNESLGMVFRTMLEQWARGGSLPADPKKLSKILQTSEDGLKAFLEEWPKLQPHPLHPDRVGIPYLVTEWNEVQGFYIEQGIKARMGGEALRAKLAAGAHGPSQGEPTGGPLREEKLNPSEPSEDEGSRKKEEEAPAGGPSAPPSFPSSAEAPVSQSGPSYPSTSEAPQGPAAAGSRPELVKRFQTYNGEEWKPTEAGLISKWNLIAEIVCCDGGKIEKVDPADKKILNQVKTFISVPYGSLKLQLAMWWIPRDPALWGLAQGDSRLKGKQGGFAAKLDKMTILDPKSNKVHEWAYKMLHVDPNEFGAVCTVWYQGEVRLIGIGSSGNPFTQRLSASAAREPLERWPWEYAPPKRP